MTLADQSVCSGEEQEGDEAGNRYTGIKDEGDAAAGRGTPLRTGRTCDGTQTTTPAAAPPRPRARSTPPCLNIRSDHELLPKLT